MNSGLMEYLPAAAPKQGADKYYGQVASGYDAKRMDDPKWTIEQAHIEDMLKDIPSGSWVLDAPCGTGRFMPYCLKRGLIYLGVDRSEDMIKEAMAKIGECGDAGQKARFALGDVRQLPREDKSVDAVINCRITRWLSPGDCQVMLRQSQRVARKKIIFTARVRNHPHARSYELIKGALDGWDIWRDETGVDVDYRIIELRPINKDAPR